MQSNDRSQTQTTFNTFVDAGTLANNYAHIFDLLIKLRQAVNHPFLVEYSETRMLEQEEATADGDGAATAAPMVATSCCVCDDDTADDGIKAGCGHLFVSTQAILELPVRGPSLTGLTCGDSAWAASRTSSV